jgi:dienelactone hydrolase
LSSPATGRESAARRLPLSVRQAGEDVPAVAWLPAAPVPPRAIVLVGHGGTMSKDSRFVSRLADQFASGPGYATLAIDAPYHGERLPDDERGLSPRQRRERLGPAGWLERNARSTDQVVADWRAAIDAALALPEVPDVPVGYFGLSMATRFGIPLAAAESRITAAVFGLFGHPSNGQDAAFAHAARQVAVPALFLLQWDDEIFPRDSGLALYEALGSRPKTLHANLGGHFDLPLSELTQGVDFLGRRLTP